MGPARVVELAWRLESAVHQLFEFGQAAGIPDMVVAFYRLRSGGAARGAARGGKCNVAFGPVDLETGPRRVPIAAG